MAQQQTTRPVRVLLVVFFVLSLTHSCHSSSSSSSFNPSDNYLINCGSPQDTVLDDGRTFKSDPSSASYLSTDEDVAASVDSLPYEASSTYPKPLFLTARIFDGLSLYRFLVNKPGRHFVRLYFYPLPHPSYNLTSATFTVTTDDFVLLHGFSVAKKTVVKEYLINITSDELTLKFQPIKKSIAFINAIEFVSAPDNLFSDTAMSVSPRGDFNGLNDYALEISYRLNVGGPTVTSNNDTLLRTWLQDGPFMTFPQAAKNVSVPNDLIRYRDGGGATPLIAPYYVHSTADQMADSEIIDSNFNLTWEMSVDPGFSYLVRLHFCDIVSKALNQLYFNVYVNGFLGVLGLDLSTLTSGLAVPYYKDFVINATSVSNSTIVVQVGPSLDVQASVPNAILNGLEVMKMSNSAKSLDGLFSADGTYLGAKPGPGLATRVIAGLGLTLGAMASILLLIGFVRRKQKGPKGGYVKQKTISSWLIPINNSYNSFLSSKTKSTATFSSIINPGLNLGRCFTLKELSKATKNFDEKAVVGVGGFGKVYLGELEDGTKVAIKRGNPSSQQGINEFQAEIQLLSKLRHRHLVSLIGYCDEQSEMILVYEYMANGPLRDHLYGSNLPSLTWRQRLEICIGSARGLHYLHTGSTQGIIHRDVKTTNILLDESFVAKVSDFGLSKAGPASLDQTHVSTAVKGSFGYLDPEYFRRQQLTEKSDVYSFGVVLFEVLCARPALDPSLPREQVNLAEWAKQQNAKGSIRKIVDPNIEGSICEEALVKYVEAAEKCLAEHGVDRPSMGDVLWHLEYALQSQADDHGEKKKDDVGRDHKEMILVNLGDDSAAVVEAPMLIENIQAR